MGLAVADHIASGFTGRLQLSVFPYLLERLIHTCHEPSVELPVLSRLIRMDPALCFLAMHLDRSTGSNSPSQDTSDIDDVVNRIGMAGIHALTTQTLANQALDSVHHRQGMALDWLWRHCLTTAMLARGLALMLNFRLVEEAYTAGLLHDIGKLALFARTPAACVPMLSDPVQAEPLIKAEEQIAGSDHSRVGAHLIRRYTGVWLAADAARYHTAAATAVVHALPHVQVVWAANRLAIEQTPSSEAYQTVGKLLNLDPQQLNRLSQETHVRIQAVLNELGAVPDVPEKDRITSPLNIPLNRAIKTSTILSHVYGELLKAADRVAIIGVLRLSLSVFLGIDTLILLDHVPQSDRLIGRYAVGNIFPFPIDRLQIPMSASQCLPVICHVNRETVNSFSSVHPEKPTIIDQQILAYIQKDGIVCMPVRSNTDSGTTIMILGIDASDWPWVEQQTTLLKTFVAAFAGALERTQQRDGRQIGLAADHIASTELDMRKVIHEINNPLSIIKNYLKALIQHSDERISGRNELRIIDEEINRVADLIRSLTSPSKITPAELEKVDVNATVVDILDLFRKSVPENSAIRLERDLDPHIPVIVSDRNRLKQALINLLKNAMEALTDGGTIQVSTRMLRNLPRHVGDQALAGHIKISVCDNGPGIDEARKNDLYKPHVTSKMGHDGLGLPIVNEAVTHLKGRLLCESIPGRETCFHIELPIGGDESKIGAALETAI